MQMTMTAKKLKTKEARKAIWSQTGMSCFSSIAVVSVASGVSSPIVTLPPAVVVVPPVDVSVVTVAVLSTT